MICIAIVFTVFLNGYGQTTIDCRPHATQYWTGRIDLFQKLDGEIKAGTSITNDFGGWAVFDITPIPSNATVTSVYIQAYTHHASSSSTHCLYVVEINVNPITASYFDIFADIGQAPYVYYSGCSDAMRTTGYHNITLNSTAISDLQSNIGSSVKLSII